MGSEGIIVLFKWLWKLTRDQLLYWLLKSYKDDNPQLTGVALAFLHNKKRTWIKDALHLLETSKEIKQSQERNRLIQSGKKLMNFRFENERNQ